MNNLVIIARPISKQVSPYLLIDNDGALDTFSLKKGQAITIEIDARTKYCTGWYDIASHTNHLCETHAVVEAKYECCFACRQKTDFNPAFYNASAVSAKQAEYNDAPHSVYAAYFGGELAKAGIMSDSRGHERLREQGALMYAVIASCPTAAAAHAIEKQLIQKGLRNSVTKRQKGEALAGAFNHDSETRAFKDILSKLGHGNLPIISNLDLFFFGKYPNRAIQTYGTHDPVSGYISGVIGQYLILENNDQLYGYWLPNLYGYKVLCSSEVHTLDQSRSR